MLDSIIDKFKNIVQEACGRFGKQEGVAPQEIQVLFSIGEEEEVKYTLLKQYKPLSDVTFNQLMGVKIDFRGYSLFVPQFIKAQLTEYAEELSVPIRQLTVMCVYIQDANTVQLWLYNGKDAVKEVVLEDL